MYVVNCIERTLLVAQKNMDVVLKKLYENDEERNFS